MNQVALITGGLGYIGSHLAKYLSQNNFEIIIIDNLSNSNLKTLKNIKKINQDIYFYDFNIRDKKLLSKVFLNHSIDIVFHLAALKSVPESNLKPFLYYRNNILSTKALLEIMKKHNVKDIIYSSTAAIYKSSTKPLKETDPIAPTNPYSKSKYYCEQLIQKNNFFRSVLLRYFNPVGQTFGYVVNENNTIFGSLVDNLINSINNNKIFYIYGNDYNTYDGTCIRDFIHIDDLVEGHVAAYKFLREKPLSGFGMIFNLGSGNGVSVLEFFNNFIKTNSLPCNVKFNQRREADIESSLADTSFAAEQLNWNAKKNLDTICKDIWSYRAK